jgi:hypothetical protein
LNTINAFLVSSIKLRPIVDNSVIAPNTRKSFRFKIESLGDHSCARIQFSSNNFIGISYTIGIDAITCSARYPGLVFRETYNITPSSEWYFTELMDRQGCNKALIEVSNERMKQEFIIYTTVSNLECINPILGILNRREHFYDPQKNERNSWLKLQGNTTLDCAVSLSNIKKWSIYQVDSKTGFNIRQIFQTENPSVYKSELVIQPNTLSYGLFKFVFSVKMLHSTIDLSNFKSEIETFVQIVSSGIVVSVFSGGANKIQIGINQSLALDPVKNSYDMDSLIQMNSLSFRYYCKVLNNQVSKDYPMRNMNEKLDLLTIQNGEYNVSSDLTCYNNKGIVLFFCLMHQILFKDKIKSLFYLDSISKIKMSRL